MPAPPSQILPGLWRIEATHPQWEGEDGGWDPDVAWWAIQTELGLLLVDPLVADWDWLDWRVSSDGGCAGVVRTIHWHSRSVAEVAERYAAEVWARRPPAGLAAPPLHRELSDRDRLPGGARAHSLGDGDELALWLGDHRALIFADVMIRDRSGRLRRCPSDWVDAGRRRPEAVGEQLTALIELDPEHVLVSHGPLVLGDGPAAYAGAAMAP